MQLQGPRRDRYTIGMLGMLKPCDNPLCKRVAVADVPYCCAACAVAHYYQRELADSGVFAHHEACLARAQTSYPT